MKKMHKITVLNKIKEGSSKTLQLLLDGQPLIGVRSFKIEVNGNAAPILHLEMFVEIESVGNGNGNENGKTIKGGVQ